MKETGITMSGDHPKLILDGIKTMTRRTRGLEEINKNPDDWFLVPKLPNDFFLFRNKDGTELLIKCPYGQVGDRLWVREKALYWDGGAGGCSDVIYTDNPEIPDLLADNDRLANYRDIKNLIERESVLGKWGWKPSIHMFRWASRILLEITEIRAERLQEITPEDILAEGCNKTKPFHSLLWNFIDLWDSLNAKRGYGWDKNNWVFPISFRVS